MAKVEVTKNKAKYWVGVCYPENMRPDWKDTIGDILQLPYAYCLHDKDKIDPKAELEEDRKDHVHIITVFGNTTTYNFALQAFNSLSKEGAVCCPSCEAIRNIKNQYEYIIHNTEDSKKKGKYPYPPSERICGNNFDIGAYIQVSADEKTKIVKEIAQICKDLKITNFSDLNDYILDNLDSTYFDVFLTHSGYFERLTRGRYQKLNIPKSSE